MRTTTRILSTLAVTTALALLTAGCGSSSEEGGDDPDGSTTTTLAADGEEKGSTTTAAAPGTTAADDDTPPETTTTNADPVVSDGELVEGSVTNADGTTATWTLSTAAGELCFDASLTHPDPTTAASLGDGVAECVEPVGGLSGTEERLRTSVGALDGDRVFGYLWGRTSAEVISLTIEHTDGTQTPVDLVDAGDGNQVFAVVVDTTTMPPVDTLDAVSGTQLEGSTPIRDFLRAGPTYPTVTPTTEPDSDLYPVVS